jgi:hypothetical protein
VEHHIHRSAGRILLTGDSDVILQPGVQKWACPNCPAYVVTHGQSNRFHSCPGLAGLTAPMILAGSDVRVRAVEREDYVGSALVTCDDNGRPVSSVVTDRPDGSNDVIAFADTAQVQERGGETGDVLDS